MLIGGTRAALALGLLGWLGGCAAQGAQQDDEAGESRPHAPASSMTSTAPGTSLSAAGSAGAAAPAGNAAGNGTTAGGPQGNTASADGCAANLPFKKAGCPCQAGQTAACWTGPAADRNIGKCHDGLQICSASGEFASWGPCMGEELGCDVPPPDAGVPPPPDNDCSCIPGAVIQCSEDCTVGIICSLTATKTCLPDRTWSTCREDLGATLDLPGVQCRNMLHGCLDVLVADPSLQGQAEFYVGDCSKQFSCGHAPQLL